MRSQLVYAAVAAILVPAAAIATEDGPVRQPEVVVTARRMPTAVDQTLAAVSVITREQIEASGTGDLLELLRSQAGIDIARGGGIGQQTSVFLRGSASNHVTVLIDGVRVAALSTGAYAFEHLPLDQVERIEIVRGPRAALYGSDAIGGVIQIFTRRPGGIDASLVAGSHGTRGAAAGWGRRTSRGGFGLRAGILDSDGFSAQGPDGFAFDPDDDGFLSRHLSLDAHRDLGTQTVTFNALGLDDAVEFDQGRSDVRQHSAAATLSGPLAPGWDHQLVLGQSRETLVTPDFFSRFDSRRAQLDWLHAVDVRSGSLMFGASVLDEHGVSIDTFSGTARFDVERDNRAAFVDWRGGAGAHDYELAARYDDNSAFGGQSTFQGAWGWQPADDWRVFASYGEGFRAPNFNELYSPGFGGLFAGNPGLQAERSRSYELGLKLAPGGEPQLGFHLFRTDIRDLIDFSGPQFMAINVRRARIDGAELQWHRDLAEWRLDASATWQQALDRDSGQRLLRRPDRKAALALARSFGARLELGLEGYAASSRPEFGGALPGYGLLAVTARYRPVSRWTLGARIENLLDRDYALARGFQTPGRTVMLRLHYQH
ncbi:MAG TPA: TonB-dependent receptor [Xanthomonadaceae bacterium]|nr:TonB-dependent receptor [Xanthomonadaceae bacterium]